MALESGRVAPPSDVGPVTKGHIGTLDELSMAAVTDGNECHARTLADRRERER